MRHYKNTCKLNRTSSHRISMFRNMIASLVDNEVIKTTLQKAKRLQSIIDPLIILSKSDSISNKRLIFSRVRNIKTVKKLFSSFKLKFINRKGGFTRIIKCGFRRGDNAKMAYISFVNI
ncbi:MAG: 50S ribosomal protein L17 [Enterobacterales bacterium]